MYGRASWVVLVQLALSAAGWADQALAPEVTVADGPLDDIEIQIAYDSAHDEYLVVWEEDDSSQPWIGRVMARRLNRYGLPLAPSFQVSTTGDGHERRNPRVAYDPVNDRYLVTFTYWDTVDWDLSGRFLAWNGPNPAWPEFPIVRTTDNEYDSAVDFAYLTATQKWLVVWQRGSQPNHTIRGALFAFGEIPVEFAIASASDGDAERPDVAYQPFGDNFLVVYDVWPNSSDEDFDIYGRLVGADGTVGPEIPIAGWPDDERFTHVASCQNWQFLVTWFSSQDSPVDRRLYARFLFGNGVMDGGPIEIAVAPDRDQVNRDVACAFEGSEYLLPYRDWVWDVDYARRISTTKVLGPEFVLQPISRGGDTVSPVVSGGRSGWFVAWDLGTPQKDIRGRAVWGLFADGFEWGSTGNWSFTAP